MTTLIEFLKTIEDHRDPQGREFQLWEVVLVSILGVLSGSQTYTAIAVFAGVHLDRLKACFGIRWKRVPHFSAIRKVLVGMDEGAFLHCFQAFSQQLDPHIPDPEGMRQICFDGKALRNSFSHTKDQRAHRIFQAFDSGKQIILCSVSMGEKDGEIQAFQTMMQEMDLKDAWISADALHCQKKHLSALNNLDPS